MNEFIEQFLLESRELADQAAEDLLALELAPGDRARLDSAFRAFHTLKGGAGIVEFEAMGTAVHAAEGVLAGVRSGTQRISQALVSDCLACLDQVGQWLDAIQDSGAFPPGAETDANAIAARLARWMDPESDSAVGQPAAGARHDAGPENWTEALLARHADARARATTAIRYAPDPDCFFRGEDPLARLAALPGLLCVDLVPATPWPLLDALDPFACNLVLMALAQGSASEVTAALGEAVVHCEVRALAALPTADLLPLSARGREVLQAQIAMLAEGDPQPAAGRIAAAGRVAANVLRHLGRQAEAEGMAKAVEGSLAATDPGILSQAIEAALRKQAMPAGPAALPEGRPGPAMHTLRVDAARIDALVNLTGELTVTKNAIGHISKLAEEEGSALASLLKDRHAALDRLVGELQRSVTGMRVLPLRTVFQRLPRLVREMAVDLGKPASLLIEGDETEADKVIVEMLFEPLLHVLRNAMDHGIETAPVRAALGKPAVSVIRLRASRQGEHVVVEVSDDGQGIDIARVRQAALGRNVAPAEVLGAMGDAQAMDLIFAPGLSTTEQVTDLSGRGVGLDAVRAAVERLAGHVAVESRKGEGSTIRFTLPFSVLMTRVMTVEAGGQKFGVPLDALVETVRVGADRIFPVGAARAVILRDRTIPLVELGGALGMAGRQGNDAEATIVVARVDGQLGALQVDRLGERMEVMLKPLDGLLSGMPGVAGATLLGDGSVLLVLDLGELLR